MINGRTDEPRSVSSSSGRSSRRRSSAARAHWPAVIQNAVASTVYNDRSYEDRGVCGGARTDVRLARTQLAHTSL